SAAHSQSAILRIGKSSVPRNGSTSSGSAASRRRRWGRHPACLLSWQARCLPHYNDRMFEFREMQHGTLHRYLTQHVDAEVRFDVATRKLYSTDASIYQIRPAGVVIPRSVDGLTTAVRIALECQVPVTARGGGTSLSGQSIGQGLIIDCSKYLNNILDIDPTARIARVQPGVVLDHLNAAAVRYGLQFGPDVATASRANIGGVIGHNSAGGRSIVYGKND